MSKKFVVEIIDDDFLYTTPENVRQRIFSLVDEEWSVAKVTIDHREYETSIPIEQRMRRTIVMIENVETLLGGTRLFTVFIPRWNRDEILVMSETQFPKDIRSKIKIGSDLIAHINVEAKSSDDLIFKNWELLEEFPDEV